MTTEEIKKAKALLEDITERTEVLSNDGGGCVLSVALIGGGQKVFYALDSVESFADDIAERRSARAD